VPPPDAGASDNLSPLSGRLSVAFSDSEYHDALEELPEALSSRGSVDGAHSPRAGAHGHGDDAHGGAHGLQQQGSIVDRIALWWEGRKSTSHGTSAGLEGEAAHTPRGPGHGHGAHATPRSLDSLQLSPDEVIEPSPDSDFKSGCIHLFSHSHGHGPRRFLRLTKPAAGSSFRRKTEQEREAQTAAAWEPADGRTFMVRSLNYMRTKVKEPSEDCIYRLLGVDVYHFDFKLFHIAQHVQLPAAPTLGPAAQALPRDQQLPPLLIINLQLPWYPASLFGSNDGDGYSLVYYFALPEGWQPSQVGLYVKAVFLTACWGAVLSTWLTVEAAKGWLAGLPANFPGWRGYLPFACFTNPAFRPLPQVPNQAALELVQRFMHNKREFDGTPTRDRLKLIPRIVNVAEWAEKGPLSGEEWRVLLAAGGQAA
jgi:hypothetical protein